VVYLRVSDKEALWRISGRSDAREDETLQALRKRIGLFHQVTEPVVEYYRSQKKLIEVNGEKPIKEVYGKIINRLKIR